MAILCFRSRGLRLSAPHQQAITYGGGLFRRDWTDTAATKQAVLPTNTRSCGTPGSQLTLSEQYQLFAQQLDAFWLFHAVFWDPATEEKELKTDNAEGAPLWPSERLSSRFLKQKARSRTRAPLLERLSLEPARLPLRLPFVPLVPLVLDGA